MCCVSDVLCVLPWSPHDPTRRLGCSRFLSCLPVCSETRLAQLLFIPIRKFHSACFPANLFLLSQTPLVHALLVQSFRLLSYPVRGFCSESTIFLPMSPEIGNQSHICCLCCCCCCCRCCFQLPFAPQTGGRKTRRATTKPIGLTTGTMTMWTQRS